MAFYDDLGRDPKSEEEFWTTIEETFVQAKGVLTSYDVETREEALTGARRIQNEGDTFRSSPGDFIRHRGVREEYDSRDYFLELGRKFLPDVERQIKARKLTSKFAKDWGVIMMCHGFISAHILDDSDGYSHQRAGFKTAEKRNKDAQRKWVAHQLLRWIDSGETRQKAEGQVESQIDAIIKSEKFPEGFGKEWFESMLKDGALFRTYDQKHLPIWKLRELATQPTDDIPPIKFPP
jgi:hypothetical protein